MMWNRALVAASRIRGARLVSTSSNIPAFRNEPMYNYEPGSAHRAAVVKALAKWKNTVTNIPVVINGREYFTNEIYHQTMPTDHGHVLANLSQADKSLINEAITVAVKARHDWAHAPFEDRAAVFLKAADLMATKYRYDLLATTMLGQGKNLWQAEIDAVAEGIDFFRYNVKAAEELLTVQPILHSHTTWNRTVYRALEGFVAAISPFNFTAIGANLAGTPALMGNSVLWKASNTAALSNYLVFKILHEAGLPDGVLNFVPADGPTFGDAVTASPHLAAINFTGSTKTFNHLWKQVGDHIGTYKAYPRLVGECGGKNFHLVHPSADIRQRLVSELKHVKQGQCDDLSVFVTAVIDRPAFNRVSTAITDAKTRANVQLIAGGGFDDSKGYFIEPTIFQTTDPKDTLMTTEFFGPLLSVYVYPDVEWNKTLTLVSSTSPYALTGAVFARERDAIRQASNKLYDSAGNFYINCKSTGAIVGQQPFGGSRSSGTNDKAGAGSYLLRFVSPQSVKEAFTPLADWKYPHMQTEQ